MAKRLSRSENMARIKSHNTKTELRLLRALWAKGLRYRINYKLIGRTDLVFTKAHLAVFIDGCFWHGCPQHYSAPNTRQDVWGKSQYTTFETEFQKTWYVCNCRSKDVRVLSLSNPGGWVKNKEISDRLKVKAPSVTNMLENLSKVEMIKWTPRKGIRLTDKGRTRAKDIVTYHILFELFLKNVLQMTNEDEINRLACDFEHHFTPELKKRLSDFSRKDRFVL